MFIHFKITEQKAHECRVLVDMRRLEAVQALWTCAISHMCRFETQWQSATPVVY